MISSFETLTSPKFNEDVALTATSTELNLLEDNMENSQNMSKLDDLSDAAKAQVSNIQFVDAQLQQLNNELAISDFGLFRIPVFQY